MALPNSPGLCAYCNEKEISTGRHRYCSAECQMAAKRARGRSRARRRKRVELALEVALLLVVNVALGLVISLASDFAANAFLWAATGVIMLVVVGLLRKRHLGWFFPRSRRGAVGISALAMIALLGTGAFELAKPPPSACARRSAADQGVGLDPRSHMAWPTVYECPTRGNGSVFKEPDFSQAIATMYGERKVWVVCWVRLSGSGIWYYTQGDAALTKRYQRAFESWGYLPHRSIDVRSQPAHSVPKCRGGMP
jgi:hypothetical protein